MSSPWVHNASPEVNAQSQWPLILGVCVGLSAIMAISVALRLYVRSRILSSVGTDDYVILFSAVRQPKLWTTLLYNDYCDQICSIIYSGLCIGQTRWGLGLPIMLRPKVNLNHYSEVRLTVYSSDVGQTVSRLLGQLCRPSFLHDWNHGLQSSSLLRLPQNYRR
jgi:hypothetical protein